MSADCSTSLSLAHAAHGVGATSQPGRVGSVCPGPGRVRVPSAAVALFRACSTRSPAVQDGRSSLRSGLVSSRLVSRREYETECHLPLQYATRAVVQPPPQDKTGTVQTPAREQDDLAAAARSGRCRLARMVPVPLAPKTCQRSRGLAPSLDSHSQRATQRRPGGKSPHGPTPPSPRFEIAGRARAVRCRVQLPVCDEIRAVWRQNLVRSVNLVLVHARLVSCRLLSCSCPRAAFPRRVLAPPNTPTPTTRAAAAGVN